MGFDPASWFGGGVVLRVVIWAPELGELWTCILLVPADEELDLVVLEGVERMWPSGRDSGGSLEQDCGREAAIPREVGESWS